MHRLQAMSILGSIPEDVEETRGSEDGKKTDKILMDCIKDAINAKANCQIHAEVKVLGYLHGHGLMGKAINSVGVSKLCCPACFDHIYAADISIQVGDTHNKWCPWHLSMHDKFSSLDQLKRTKQRIFTIFGPDWWEHLVDQRQRLHSFGNYSESSRSDATSEIEKNVPETEFDDHRIIEGAYRKKILG